MPLSHRPYYGHSWSWFRSNNPWNSITNVASWRQRARWSIKNKSVASNCMKFVLCEIKETSCIITDPSVHACGFGSSWISATQLTLEAKGEERGGPSGQRINRCLYSLRIIEQISNEQLLPVKMTCFHFITMDKRSDSICMLQLSAILIRLPIPAFNISWQT